MAQNVLTSDLNKPGSLSFRTNLAHFGAKFVIPATVSWVHTNQTGEFCELSSHQSDWGVLWGKEFRLNINWQEPVHFRNMQMSKDWDGDIDRSLVRCLGDIHRGGILSMSVEYRSWHLWHSSGYMGLMRSFLIQTQSVFKCVCILFI